MATSKKDNNLIEMTLKGMGAVLVTRDPTTQEEFNNFYSAIVRRANDKGLVVPTTGNKECTLANSKAEIEKMFAKQKKATPKSDTPPPPRHIVRSRWVISRRRWWAPWTRTWARLF